MLKATDIRYAYAMARPVLQGVSFTLSAGTILYLLGRNGSGKTTLLGCLSGSIRTDGGTITFHGRDIYDYTPRERAQHIGLIPQLHTPAFAYTVRDMVLMGRAPHLGLFDSPGREDYEITDEALENVGLMAYRDRPYTKLSGGERQLVLIARGLAQRCTVLLMDEPDAHLDLNNQQRVMKIVSKLAESGLSFIVSSHVPNNALNYAHQILLMKAGGVLAFGSPYETLTAETLSLAYDLTTEVIYETINGEHKPRAVVPGKP